jgi:glycosyltransferase involved in cell wall biosynthesis
MAVASFPRVSVIMAARNEEKYIERCLRSLLASSLPESQLEIVVADGGSTDRTREIVLSFAARHPCIRLIDNPEKVAPTGFNYAIKASRGDTILLLSAHSAIDPDFIPVCLAKLDETGADVAGGVEIAVAAEDSLEAVLATSVLDSRFGVGSSFRTVHKEGFVDTVSPALYRRSVFERVGLFDERLIRNQDNEFNSRLRAAGLRIWMTPAVRAYYYGRTSIVRLLRQNYLNGYYAMLNWRITPASVALRHVMPLLFVVGLVVGGVLASIHECLAPPKFVLPEALWIIYFAVLGLYVVMAVYSTLKLVLRRKSAGRLLTVFLFPVLHITYGIGTLTGIFRFGFMRISRRGPDKLTPRPGSDGDRNDPQALNPAVR